MRIKALREARGLKQDEVADKLGWTAATLSRVENGRQNTKLSSLEELATFYEVSVPELFEYDGNNPLLQLAWQVPEDQAPLGAEMIEVLVRHAYRPEKEA